MENCHGQTEDILLLFLYGAYAASILIINLKFHLAMIHFLTAGGHLGRDKTLEKVSRFYWKEISNDIKNYIKLYDICQRTNDAKFVKAGCELHPIPVKAEVWNMVKYFIP